jgi:membrane protein
MANPLAATTREPESTWKLGGLTWWQLSKTVAQGINECDLFGRASELAFSFLFALFPLMLCLLAVFGLFASRSLQLQAGLLSYLADFLPPGAFQLMKEVVTELATTTASGKLTLGLILALWFASGGISSMISTLNGVYRVRESRSWLMVRGLALGLTVAISALLFVATFAMLEGTHCVDWLGAKLRLTPVIVVAGKWSQWPLAIFFAVLSFSLIYYCGPSQEHRKWHWVSPGSLFGALIWLAASLGFRVYLHFFNTYTETYGSLGALMILVVWLYVTGLAFLVGGQINAEIAHAALQAYVVEKSQSGENLARAAR